VAAINDMIRAAFTSKDSMPLFGYVAPYRSQAKSVVWDYLKHYSRPISKEANEAELTVTLLNNSKIRLFGADNADAMRGLGFSGVYLDEFGDFKPSVWGNVVRPALSDKQGWCVFGGTPKGKNQFYDIRQTAARQTADWFLLELPASKSGLLPATELDAARSQLSKDQFDQEYECSFEAAILGAFYGTEMREATEEGRICQVDYQPEVPVHTAWDLGYRDDTAIWFYQVIRGEIHVIDYYAVSGANIASWPRWLTASPTVRQALPAARCKGQDTGRAGQVDYRADGRIPGHQQHGHRAGLERAGRHPGGAPDAAEYMVSRGTMCRRHRGAAPVPARI
jgi:phage terminase large subunit